MSKSVQLTTGPMEVRRLDGLSSIEVQKADPASETAEITLEMAKAQIGRAVRKVITRTDSKLQAFGDPSLVKRFCDGEVPSVLARAWQTKQRRQQFFRALAEEETSIRAKTVYEVVEEKAS